MGVLDNTLLARVEALEAELAAIRGHQSPIETCRCAGRGRATGGGGSAGLGSPRCRQAARRARSEPSPVPCCMDSRPRRPMARRCPGTRQQRHEHHDIDGDDNTALTCGPTSTKGSRQTERRERGSFTSGGPPLGRRRGPARCGWTRRQLVGGDRRRPLTPSGASSRAPGRPAHCTCWRRRSASTTAVRASRPAIDPKTPLTPNSRANDRPEGQLERRAVVGARRA